MDVRFSVKENQLVHALTVALISAPKGNVTDVPAVKQCLESMEMHYMTGGPSPAFSAYFYDFTGNIYHHIDGKRQVIAQVRIGRDNRARAFRLSPEISFSITATNKTAEYLSRRHSLRQIGEIHPTSNETALCTN